MAEIIKIKEVDRTTPFPAELIVAKLRAVDKYCSLSNLVDRDIIRLSANLADRIKDNATISANDFQNKLEETLRSKYDEEGQTSASDEYCNVMRLYFIECIIPEILDKSLVTEVKRLYGIRES